MSVTDPADDVAGAAALAAAAAAAAAATWEALRFRGKLPDPGADIAYVGHGIAAGAEDVWNWVTGTAKKTINLASSVVAVTLDEVTTVVEAYGGQLLKSAISLINDLAKLTASEFSTAYLVLAYATGELQNAIDGIDTIIGLVDGVVVGIENVTIPALLTEIIRLGASIEPRILEGLANVETWAIDNIYDPVQTDIVRTAGDLYDAIQNTADWVTATAEGLVSAETLARIEALASLDAIVAAIAGTATIALTWVEECGAPMCSYAGPNTDLGKFLKLLNLAGEAALLAELASLDGAGIENMLRALVSLSHGVIDDVDALFTGGETVGSLLAHAGG